MKRRGLIFLILVCFASLMLAGCGGAPASQGYAYEGEKKDGLAHGSGILYKDGDLIYEGAFEEGYRLGYGSIFADGVKTFEGEILENDGEQMLLDGTLYDDGGVPLFTGEITIDGTDVIPAEYGTLYYETGDILYTGELTNGEPGDNGTYYNMDGGVLLDPAGIR